MATIQIQAKPIRAASTRKEYVYLPLAVVQLDNLSHLDLYRKVDGTDIPVLYRSASIPISPKDIDELRRNGHRALYVASSDRGGVDRAINESLQTTLSNETIPLEDRFAILQAAVAIEIDHAFNLIRCDRFVSMSQRIAKDIAALLDGDKLLPQQLFAVVQHDYYTYTHVVNVAGFAALLADMLGFSDPRTREQIIVGSLLHDIGKRFISSSILCKSNALTTDEWQLIRTHPQRGFEDLHHRNDLTEEQLLMVYSHHERFDGKGYPVGLVGKEIHPWARLLAVVDVFDAITSIRPYRKPMSLPQGIEYLRVNSGTHFDPEMVRCWMSAMNQR